MAAMATEVGHHIGVPVLCPGLSTDAKHAGIQAGYEKAMKAATVCAAGPDIVTGWGLIDSHNTMSLPQSVIDNEMAGMLRRLNAPVEVSEATLAGAAVASRGPRRRLPRPEGHGAAHPRRRALHADGLDRLSYEKWVDEGGDEYDDACALVEAAPRRDTRPGRAYIDGDQLDELAAICRVDEDTVRRARRA